MNRVLHFKQTEESKVYFSSDFHFFHNPKCGGNSVIDILHNYDFLEICHDDHENYIDFIGDEHYIDKHIRDKHTIRKMGKYRYFYSHQNANKSHMDEFFKFTFVRNPYTKILSSLVVN